MEALTCTCQECGAELGKFINLWTQIGTNYFSPVVDPDELDAIVAQGSSRWGESGTVVGGCLLQDISCVECASSVGLKCLQTPVNYVLEDNQLLLRFSSISLRSRTGGAKAKLLVNRLLKLRDTDSDAAHDSSSSVPKSADGSRSQGDSVDVAQLQACLEAHEADIHRLDSGGKQIVSAFDGAVGRIEKEVKRLQDTMLDLRRELDGSCDDLSSLKTGVGDLKDEAKQSAMERKRLRESLGDLGRGVAQKDTVERLEHQLKSATKAVGDLKQSSLDRASEARDLQRELAGAKTELKRSQADITNLREEVKTLWQEAEGLREVAETSNVTMKEYAREVAALRHEMKQFKQDAEHSRAQRSEAANGSFSSKELDILTTNIAKIGSRASQVETLQMEFQLFKSRLQRIESAQKEPQSGRRTMPTPLEHPGPDAFHDTPKEAVANPMPVPTPTPPARRKRNSTNREAVPDSTGSNKRRALSQEYDEEDDARISTPIEWPETSPAQTETPTGDRKADGRSVRAAVKRRGRKTRPGTGAGAGKGRGRGARSRQSVELT